MKHLSIILILLLSGILSLAQTPEPVYSFALEKRSSQWYKNQIQAWKNEIKKDSSNGLAWYYLYYATRNLQRTDDPRPDSVKAGEMKKLIHQLKNAIPNTYEYHLVMWMSNMYFPDSYKHLEQLYKLGEGRTEHIDFVVNDGEVQRDLDKRNKAILRKWDAGLLSPGMANYNRNVLAGLSENSILLTSGDNDTYPAWYVQATGYRSDVHVLNLSILMITDYRKKISKELGIDFIEIDWDAESEKDPNHVSHFYEKLIPALTANTKGHDVYVGLTAMGNKELVSEHEEDLYLTGLAYKYSTESIDERALLKRNFEQRYALDYILQSFYQDISAELVPQINLNYIVPMFKLYEHYSLSGDATRKEWLKPYLIKISKGTENEKQVLKLIEQ